MADNNKVEYVLSLRDLFSGRLRKATGDTERLNSTINKTKSSLGGLGSSLKTAFATLGAGILVKEIVTATATLEGLKNQINFASGSVEQGGKDFEYLRQQANYLGLDLQTAATAFAQLEGATRGTVVEGQKTRDIFEGVSMASTVMHLSAEQSGGALNALQQMMSKVKVSAEEMNGQLGERIPGALNIASRAMNMSTADLMKMMQNGELFAADFLPKFANQLKKEFAGGIEVARHSVTANLNRMSTAWFELKTALGESVVPAGISALSNVLTKIVAAFNKGIEFVKRNFELVQRALQPIIDEVNYLKDSIFGIGSSFNWTKIFEQSLNAIGSILRFLQPFIHAAIWGFNIILQTVIATTNAIISLINAIGSLVGYEYKKLNPKTAADAMSSPLTSGANSSTVGASGLSGTSSSKKSKSGTTTEAVEARGHQNFNIDIKNLIEKLEIRTTNLKESGAAIKAEVTKAMIGAVNDFQLMATK